MHFTTAVVIAALPFLVSAASPTPKHLVKVPLSKRFKLTDKHGVVNVAALNAHVAKIVAKIDRGYDNYEKNTGAPHPNAKGLQKRNYGINGSVLLTDQDSQLWQGEISVGTPPSTFIVDFDTGSGDMFLPGSKCKTNCKGHKIYNTDASSTAKDLGKTFKLRYNDGSSVSGEQFTDTVHIAGFNASTQTIGSASNYSTGFEVSQFSPDGLMGMSFKSISVFGASPVVDTLRAQGQLAEPVFAFKFATSGSELTIGGTDPSHYSGGFTYAPVTYKAYWTVIMDGVIGNGKRIRALDNTIAIIDTGSTLIFGDTRKVSKFYEAIGGKNASSTVGDGYYTFRCDKVPRVSLTFGGHSFPFSESTFNRGQDPTDSSQCIGAIVAIDYPVWIIGDAFLTNVYTVFDYGNSSDVSSTARVGFATLA